MLIAGIVLVVLQCVGVAGSFIGGNNPFKAGFPELVGYFLCGLIGVFLIISHKKRKKKRSSNDKNTAQKELAVTTDKERELSKVLKDLENDPDRYFMDKSLAEKYTRIFKEPFDQVIEKSEFIVNNKKCDMYGFSPLYLNRCIRSGFDIGRFAYFVVVQGETPRYFASEYSFNNTFVLCEWEFEGEIKTGHINYGEIVSSVSDMMNHSSNIKKKLQEILT